MTHPTLSRQQEIDIIKSLRLTKPRHYITLLRRYHEGIYNKIQDFNVDSFNEVSNSQKAYNFCNDITVPPTCPVTKTRLNFINNEWQYRKYGCRGVSTQEQILKRSQKRIGSKFIKKHISIDSLPTVYISYNNLKKHYDSIIADRDTSLSIICQLLKFKYPHLKKQIIDYYKVSQIPFKALVYCIHNDIETVPRCKYDPQYYCTFDNAARGFRNYNVKNHQLKKKETISNSIAQGIISYTKEECIETLTTFIESLPSLQNLKQCILAYDRNLHQSILYYTPNIEGTFSKKCYLLLNGNPKKKKDRVKLHYQSFNKGFIQRFLHSSTSKGEEEVFEYVKSLMLEVTKTRVENCEIDIFVKEKNIGIEYNGEYYHSNKFMEPDHHLTKTLFFKGKGIDIIHIWESEWYNKQDIIKSILQNKLGCTPTKIFARKCEIRHVDKLQKREFLKTNHIQGDDLSSIALGLFFENTLVSIMTFGRRKITGSSTYELLRFCNLLNTTVVGGASKLFKFFLKNNWDGRKITTYCDVRLSPSSSFYEQLGFSYVKRSVCNYFYFKSAATPYLKLQHRSNFMKHTLVSKLEVFDNNKTEKENMAANGYFWVYDCGSYVYEYCVNADANFEEIAGS